MERMKGCITICFRPEGTLFSYLLSWIGNWLGMQIKDIHNPILASHVPYDF